MAAALLLLLLCCLTLQYVYPGSWINKLSTKSCNQFFCHLSFWWKHMAKESGRKVKQKAHSLQEWPPIWLICNREALPKVPVHCKVPQQTELGGGEFGIENSYICNLVSSHLVWMMIWHRAIFIIKSHINQLLFMVNNITFRQKYFLSQVKGTQKKEDKSRKVVQFITSAEALWTVPCERCVY